MKSLFYMFLFLFCVPIFSSPNERTAQNEIYVGDEVNYEMKFDSEIPASLQIKEGEHYTTSSSSDLPIFKIWNVKKEGKLISLSVRFYEAGGYKLPIHWEEGGEEQSAKLMIEVKSQLTGNESDIDDIQPPLEFSGAYFLRLFFVILIILAFLYIAYAVYLKFSKRKKILDANWEKIPTLENRQVKLIQIESALKQTQIPYKDLLYLISSYFKEEFSHRLSGDLLHLTDSEFLSYLYDRSHLDNESVRDIRNILRTSKYTDHSQILTQEEAAELWQDWKNKLKL